MKQLIKIIRSKTAVPVDSNGKTAVSHFGLFSCANQVFVRHVPFDSSCMILVLQGTKVMSERGKEIVCEAGNILTVPSPGSYDLRNVPDSVTGRYQALVIPFQANDLERLRQVHELDFQQSHQVPEILFFKHSEELLAAIEHYLSADDNSTLLKHRLLELLLILASENSSLFSYTLAHESWSGKVRAILATDLSKKWEINDVCKKLATSESTLRRHLKNEQTGFRDLLTEQRLTTALMQLLQSSEPVSKIAYDCGYQSVSRFSSNFSKRFGLAPSAFRHSLTENENNLTVSGQHQSQ